MSQCPGLLGEIQMRYALLRERERDEAWAKGKTVLTSGIQVTLDLYNEVPYLRASFGVLETQGVVGSVGFRPYY